MPSVKTLFVEQIHRPAKLTLFSPSYVLIHLSSKEVAFGYFWNSSQGGNHETQGTGEET